MPEHEDCDTVGDAITAVLGIIHGKSQGMALLETCVAKGHLVQASVDGVLSFATAVLEQ